ncbi:hypothetical protein WMC41_15930 [Shinella yambaruensis]|uniref:hypothetical protein n=1 Tax=Shinella yambaruensis TaxID=415996 RepID=UPI003D7AA78C
MNRLFLSVAMAAGLYGAAYAEDGTKCAAGSPDIVKVDYWSPFLAGVMVDYINATGREIQMIHAKAIVTDALGAVVAEAELPPDEALGVKAMSYVIILVDPKRKISSDNIGNFKAVVCTTSVLYKGGETQSF